MAATHDETAPDAPHIVLAGGGHAHALLLRRWGASPPAGIRLTLVSPDDLTPYSGMLPGLVAGHYTFSDMHIDLANLCRWAGVTFRRDVVTGLDPSAKHITLGSGKQLAYDLLSLDTGSVPDQGVPGVAEHAIPVKPISGFWPRWQAVLQALQDTDRATRLAIVGGGAGSLELCLAMAHACRQHTSITHPPRFSLLTAAQELLPEFPEKARRIAHQACIQAGVEVHTGSRVAAVGPANLQTDDGKALAIDHVFWCTQAAAPQWPARAGLTCDDAGFVTVNAYLQSVSHEHVFAAGDIAHMALSPRPKAGVFAVRQAPVLMQNLLGKLAGRNLEAFVPQHSFLSLLALGQKKAVGSRGGFTVSGKWAWHWKHHIDLKFMRQFSQLP